MPLELLSPLLLEEVFKVRTGFSQVAARCRADLEQSSSGVNLVWVGELTEEGGVW